MTGTMMAGINTDTYSWTGSGTAVVVVPFILHHYFNEADAYVRNPVAEKPPLDKETVSCLRKIMAVYLIVVAHSPDVTTFGFFLVSW